MKEYVVSVKDAITEELAFNKARNVLRSMKNAFATIYGYTKAGKDIWLVEPIVCFNQNDVLKWQKKFNGNRQMNQVVLHTLFKQNVDQ